MTLDGYCDHTAVDPDAAIHRHYEEVVRNADVMLYGRITYQLMEFWKTLVEQPSGDLTMDQFAQAMDQTPKVVFSTTLQELNWASARLAVRSFEEEVGALKKAYTGNILVGSPGLIVAGLNANLIDEFQLCIHPVLVGQGMSLFKQIAGRKSLKLIRTKTFDSGAIVLYYEPA